MNPITKFISDKTAMKSLAKKSLIFSSISIVGAVSLNLYNAEKSKDRNNILETQKSYISQAINLEDRLNDILKGETSSAYFCNINRARHYPVYTFAAVGTGSASSIMITTVKSYNV